MDKYENLTTAEKSKIPKPEIVLDFSEDPNGKILININKNDSFSKSENFFPKNTKQNSIIYYSYFLTH